jgi:hypothetical protein
VKFCGYLVPATLSADGDSPFSSCFPGACTKKLGNYTAKHEGNHNSSSAHKQNHDVYKLTVKMCLLHVLLRLIILIAESSCNKWTGTYKVY